MGTKIYMIAGEASGDMHGANLLRAMKALDGDLTVRAWGGDRMKEAGADIIRHYRELAFMGFTEVLMNIGTIMRNFRFCYEDISAFGPDAIVLIDYPGFNLRVARWAHSRGIKVLYYISPQVWAWKQNRVHAIGRYVDRMFVVLPFEQDFYKKFGYEVSYHGHPLLDEFNRIPVHSAAVLRAQHNLGTQPLIALLPGSRKQEIVTMLPIMLSVMDQFPAYRFVVAAAPSQPRSLYEGLIGTRNVPIIAGQTYTLLAASEAALVTSGTATLETGLLGIPQVVCYKGGTVSYLIARRLIRVKYISLVNLILDRPAVTELIQHRLTTANLSDALRAICQGGDTRTSVLAACRELAEKLQGTGASARTASEMLKIIRS